MNYKFEPLDMKEHRRCPDCPRLMIKRVSNPVDCITPMREWYWWCNCGNEETGGILRGISELEYYKKEWERVNNIRREE